MSSNSIALTTLNFTFNPGSSVEETCASLNKQLENITEEAAWKMPCIAALNELSDLAAVWEEYKVNNPPPLKQEVDATPKKSKIQKFKGFLKSKSKSEATGGAKVQDSPFTKVDCQLRRLNEIFENVLMIAKEGCKETALDRIREATWNYTQALEKPDSAINSIVMHSLKRVVFPSQTLDKQLREAIELGLKFCYPKSTSEYIRKSEIIFNAMKALAEIELNAGATVFDVTQDRKMISSRYYSLQDFEEQFLKPLLEKTFGFLNEHRERCEKLLQGEVLNSDEVTALAKDITLIIAEDPSFKMTRVGPAQKEKLKLTISRLKGLVATIKTISGPLLSSTLGDFALKGMLLALTGAVDKFFPLSLFEKSNDRRPAIEQKVEESLLQYYQTKNPSDLNNYLENTYDKRTVDVQDLTPEEYLDLTKSAIVQVIKFAVKNNLAKDIIPPLICLIEATLAWQGSFLNDERDHSAVTGIFLEEIEKFIAKIIAISPDAVKALQNEKFGLGRKLLSCASRIVEQAPAYYETNAFTKVETAENIFIRTMTE